MKKTFALLLALFLGVSTALWASPQQTRMKTCAAEYHKQNIEKSHYKAFMKTCLKTSKTSSKAEKKTKTTKTPKAEKPLKKQTQKPEKHPLKASKPIASNKAAPAPVVAPTPANPSFPQSTNASCPQQAQAMNLQGEAKQEFIKTCSNAN